MPSKKVVSPFTSYYDIDGDPLESGFIYIGQSGLNPEISPISTFWDPELTIPAAQPIRTLGGYPSNSGAPANVYVDASTYSITIRNKNGTLVVSRLSAGAEDGPFTVENVTTMAAMSLAVGAEISTQGRLVKGDGGDGQYLVESGDTSDGFGRILLANGNTAVLQENVPSIVQLGATTGVDHSAVFTSALASGKKFTVPNLGYTYTVSGTLPFTSNSVMSFVGDPTISITVTGDERGFHFADGVTDAYVEGTADILFSVPTAGSDGSFSNAFCFGQFYYVGDASGTLRCGIKDKLRFTLNGPANGNPIAIYGYSEDCFYVAPQIISGTTNIAFPAHWGGNGSSGVLPTKTWHPHRCEIRGAFANNVGSNFNGVILSSVGEFFVESLTVENVEEGLLVFVGDYGFTFADNITEKQAVDVTVDRFEYSGSFDYGVSVDMQSSGLNSSPIWTGSDHNARLVINKMVGRVTSAATASRGLVASGLDSLIVRDFDFKEEGIVNTSRSFEAFGCNYIFVRGRAITRSGHLFRNCGYVNVDIATESPEKDVDSSFFGISISQTSASATTSGAISIGDEAITLTSASLVVGPGGFLQFGGEEMEILSSTFVGGVQTITISPSTIAIPDASNVTLIQTIKKMDVGPSEIKGFRVGIRNTGTATAKMRNLTLRETSFNGCGVYDVEADEVKGFRAISTRHSNSGKTTTTTNRYGILIGANTEQFIVLGPHFDDTCGGLQYGVQVNVAARAGIVDDVVLDNYNAAASNPAAVFNNLATDVKIGTVVASGGRTEVYP